LAAFAASSKGKAVIDCGATETVAGLQAIQDLYEERCRRHGPEGITIDRSQRRRFRFGNGAGQEAENYTTVTVAVAGREAQLGIHGMEAPGVPILLSVKALEKLGAIIDFKRGVAILSEVSDRVIKLERAPSGHYVLDLAFDMVFHAAGAAKAVASEEAEGVRKLLDHNQ